MSAVEPALLDDLAERLIRAGGSVRFATLADECGCGPPELAEMLGALRALGAPLRESSEACALALPDPLDAAAMRAAMPQDAGIAVRVHRVCASTNEAVRHMPIPALCVAEAQTAGRGRRGTQWLQPFGAGLALSLAVATPSGRPDPLAIVFAVAVAQWFAEVGWPDIRIKWPNDLYANDAKLGGLMVHMDGADSGRLIIGLGLNVLAAPTVPGRAATALAEFGPAPSRNMLAAGLATAILAALKRYEVEGFAPFAAAFSERDWLAGRDVTLRDGDSLVRGTARGIDATGALILDTGERRRLCRAGEVTLNPSVFKPPELRAGNHHVGPVHRSA